MISNETILNVMSVAGEVAELGKKVLPSAGTPLSELTRLSSPPMLIETDSIPADQVDMQFAMSCELASFNANNELSQHSAYSDNLIDLLSKSVSSHISFARNTVKPNVIDFTEKLNAEMAAYSNTNPAKDFNIIILNTPELLKDESFQATIEVYNNKKILSPDVFVSIENKTDEEITGMLTTGHSRTNKMLANWLTSLDEGFIRDAWENFFVRSKNNLSFDNIQNCNAYKKADYGLLIFLLASYLQNNASSNDDVDLRTYKEAMKQLKDFAGALLSGAAKAINLFNKTTNLVIENSYAKKSISVNGDVYNQWIQSGGNIEVLLGLLVSQQNINNLTLINEKSNDLIKQWKSFCTFETVQLQNNAMRSFKNIIKSLFIIGLDNMSEEEKIASENKSKETMFKLLDKELDELTSKDMDDFLGVSLKVICKCRFYYTSAYNILKDINDIGKINPDIDVREAALISAINYMSDYFVDQMTVK